MRRTATKVLVPAVFFLLTVAGPPSLPAQARSTTSSAQPASTQPASKGPASKGPASKTPASHAAAKAARHASTPSNPRKGSQTKLCAPSRAAAHGANHTAARKRQACATPRSSRPQRYTHPRQASAPKTPDRRSRPQPQAAITEAEEAPVQPAPEPDGPAIPAPVTRPIPTPVAHSIPAPAAHPAPAPTAQPASLNLTRMPMLPPLRGSLASLERQNEIADAEGLERIEDEDDLSDRIARKFLVPVPVSEALAINPDLPDHHRYCRPWTARFLADMARAHAAQFRAPIQVSSAVRTVAYQKHLIAINGNAAPAEGDIASPHLTGATIDIAKSGMSRQEIAWMRYWLLPLQSAGKIDVEEEFQQSCFHITVYKSYLPPRRPSSIAHAKPAQPLPVPQKSSPSKTQTRQLNRDIAAAAPALGR
jgi:hypothetical protein